LWEIKGKPNKYLKIRTVPKYNRTFVETETKLKSLKHITAPFHGLVHFLKGKFTASNYSFWYLQTVFAIVVCEKMGKL